ncbi:MAG: RHS repeat domain-containing protein, partial [Terriglobia bacterium]
VGTTFMVTDSSGNVVQDELHYPWGQEWTMVGTLDEERFARLEHRDAETELDPTHFRMFSSSVGRWQSPDPMPGHAFNPQSFDRYAYAGNDPAGHIDPQGAADCTYVYINSVFSSGGCNELGQVRPGGPAFFSGLEEDLYQQCIESFSVCNGRDFSPEGAFEPGGGGEATAQPSSNINVRTTETPAPPLIYQHAPPPTTTPTGKYSDYLVCVGDEAIILGFGNADRTFATIGLNLAPFVLGEAPPAAAAFFGTATAYDLKLEFQVRETCMEEVYGHP